MTGALRPRDDIDPSLYHRLYQTLGGEICHEVKADRLEVLWSKLKHLKPCFDEVSFHGVHERRYRYNKRVYSVFMDGGSPYEAFRVVKLKRPKPQPQPKVHEAWVLKGVDKEFSSREAALSYKQSIAKKHLMTLVHTVTTSYLV